MLELNFEELGLLRCYWIECVAEAILGPLKSENLTTVQRAIAPPTFLE